MKIRSAQAGDGHRLIQLIAAFRASLAELHGRTQPIDLASAGEELAEYIGKGFPIYVAEDAHGALVGYLVCRVDGDVVWAESLYTMPEYRRQGIGSLLYAEAERLARELGSDSPYNWVDPNNEGIICFLQKRDYNTLNLIELRRPYAGEEPVQQIKVGPYEFDL